MEHGASKLTLIVLPIVLLMSLVLGIRNYFWKPEPLFKPQPIQLKLADPTVYPAPSPSSTASDKTASNQEEIPISPPESEAENARIEIHNGSGKRGMAKDLADKLKNLGLDVIAIGDAGKRFATTTIIYPLHQFPGTFDRLSEVAALKYAILSQDSIEGMGDVGRRYPDILIILGENYAP